MILVMLGTQKNSFHRLLEQIEICIEKKVINEKVIVQAGCTEFETKNMEIFDLISEDELNILKKNASFIITHGGVGSIVSSLKMGKKIIAVPRLHEYGEHVNNHQLQIVQNFDDNGYIIGIENVTQIEEAIRKMPSFEPKELISNTENIIKIVSEYIDNH